MNDSHDATPGNGICDDGTGHCSLRAAVEEASASGITVNVVLPAGSYNLSSAFGQLHPTDPGGLQISGAGAGSTTIVGAPGDTVVDVTQDASANGSFLQLTNVTLLGNGGEVIDIEDGNDVVNLSGSTVASGSQANGYGGGIFNDGQLWATSTTFVNNTANVGGAIFNDNGSIRLTGDVFNNNSVTGDTAECEYSSGRACGGALYNRSGPVAVDSTTFSSNSATNSDGNDADGGAIYSSDQTELTNDIFNGNSAKNTTSGGDGNGGAVYDNYGLAQVVGSTFTQQQHQQQLL